MAQSKTWKDCHRYDLKMIPVMDQAGWHVVFDSRDVLYKRTTPMILPHECVYYKKEAKVVWYTPGQKVNVQLTKKPEEVWTVADIINGSYSNHRHYENLEKVIEHE